MPISTSCYRKQIGYHNSTSKYNRNASLPKMKISKKNDTIYYFANENITNNIAFTDFLLLAHNPTGTRQAGTRNRPYKSKLSSAHITLLFSLLLNNLLFVKGQASRMLDLQTEKLKNKRHDPKDSVINRFQLSKNNIFWDQLSNNDNHECVVRLFSTSTLGMCPNISRRTTSHGSSHNARRYSRHVRSPGFVE